MSYESATPRPHQTYQPLNTPLPPPSQRPQPLATHSDAFAEPVSVFSSAPPRGEPVRLYRDKREEELNSDMYEDMSALFSIITATERLENIWARRAAISQQDYEQECEGLIQQFRVLRSSTESSIPKIDKFIAEYEIKANKARARLVTGVPATVHAAGTGGGRNSKEQGKFVFRCTSLFHHLGYCIDMDQLAVGMLLPDLLTLMKTLNRISGLGKDYDFNAKIRAWVEKLNSMPAAEELPQDQAMQLKLDLDNGYADLESAISD